MIISQPWESTDRIGRTQDNSKGGIDLNPKAMDLQVNNTDEDFQFNGEALTIDASQVAGIGFTIRQIRPVVNLAEALQLN